MTAEQKKSMLMEGQGRESTVAFRNKTRADQYMQHKKQEEEGRRMTEAKDAKDQMTSNLWRGKQPQDARAARPKTAPAARDQPLPKFRRRAAGQEGRTPVPLTQAKVNSSDTDAFLNTLGLNSPAKREKSPARPEPAACPLPRG